MKFLIVLTAVCLMVLSSCGSAKKCNGSKSTRVEMGRM